MNGDKRIADKVIMKMNQKRDQLPPSSVQNIPVNKKSMECIQQMRHLSELAQTVTLQSKIKSTWKAKKVSCYIA